jgi:hypothetical protein
MQQATVIVYKVQISGMKQLLPDRFPEAASLLVKQHRQLKPVDRYFR